MAKSSRKFPIGVQTFSDIVLGNYYYVDKTGFVHKVAEKYSYVFLNRPRRFGKSLLSSTFHCYFEGRKELFDGLEAGRLKTEWKKHPVFHFDMSTVKYLDTQILNCELDRKLYNFELVYGRGDKELDFNQRLAGLVKRAYEQTGERAVIIIDEYDAPFFDVMNDKVKLEPMKRIMRNFYSPIKSLDPYLRFVFITGITKLVQMSLCSELNNFLDISMRSEFSAICGISQAELERDLHEPVQALADAQQISYEEALGKLKLNYDGYHFCGEPEDIYNPFSLINALSDRDYGSYWFDSGTPTYLYERLRRNPIDEAELDRMPFVPKDNFDVSPEISDNSLPMLYQTGYLTIKSYDKRMQLYTLGYPNREVKIGFTRGILDNYHCKTETASGFVAQFYAAMDSGDIDLALEKMKAYLAGIPNDLENKSEKHYQTIIYLIFSLLGYYIATEVKSAIGRADAVCHTDNAIFVFEFKVDGSAEDALKQIDEKGYMLPYKFEEGKSLVKVGVNISSASRTVDSWVVG